MKRVTVGALTPARSASSPCVNPRAARATCSMSRLNVSGIDVFLSRQRCDGGGLA